MLEQMRGLGIDLERVLLIEQARVEPLIVHNLSVLQTTTHALMPRQLAQCQLRIILAVSPRPSGKTRDQQPQPSRWHQ